MSGNTRGKLKEHFEGIHSNIDWAMHHCTQSLALICEKTKETEIIANPAATDADILSVAQKNPLYGAIKNLGEGLEVFDELAQGIYAKF